MCIRDRDKNWLVVTRVLKATTTTVLISESSSSSVELSAKMNLSGMVASLGEAETGLAIKGGKGEVISSVGDPNLTPLFQLGRLKTSFFSPPKLVTKSFRASDPSLLELTPEGALGNRAIEESLSFETVTDDELIEE